MGLKTFDREILPITKFDDDGCIKKKVEDAFKMTTRKWIYSSEKNEEEVYVIHTIGMHSLNMPELIIMGPYEKDLALYIDFYSVHQYSFGQKFLESEIFDHKLLEQPLAVVTIDDKYKRELMKTCNSYYEHWNFDAQQIIVSDNKKRLPWHEAFDPRLSMFQKVLSSSLNKSIQEYRAWENKNE